MIRRFAFIFLIMLPCRLFRPHNNLEHCLVDFGGGNCFFVSARGKNCRFVKQIFQIRTRESVCCFCNGFKRNARVDRLILRMNLKDCFAPFLVWIINNNLPVKSARAEKRRVENIGAVRCGNHDNSLIRAEAVHFNKQLIKSLLAFIVTAAQACTALAADCVNFVNKNNCRKIFACLLKKVSHAACTNADKHFNKV